MLRFSCTGTFDAERIKQGFGTYVWMGLANEEEPDGEKVEKARFEGNYKDGLKTGFGKMVYPNGDIYEGEWVENDMQGEGTYTYKKTGDIFVGSWFAGKKHGKGSYYFGADSSQMTGTWENGQILAGSWTLKDCSVYTGEFKLGRPYGAGKFDFAGGLSQSGAYEEFKTEDEEEPAEGDPPKPPNVAWKGTSIVSFSNPGVAVDGV